MGLGGPRTPQGVLKLELGVTARGVPAGVWHLFALPPHPVPEPGTLSLVGMTAPWRVSLGAGGKARAPGPPAGAEAGPTRALSR